MLTTSRGQVIVDNNLYGGQSYNQELPSATLQRSFSPVQSDMENEYSLAEITKKILGDSTTLPNEYDEVVDNNPMYAPSNKTMSYADDGIRRATLPTDNSSVIVKKSSLTNAQIKIALASFGIVVLVLAMLIAFASVGVNAVYGEIAVAESQLIAQSEVINTLNEQSANVDEATVLSLANALGYSVPDSSNTVLYEVPTKRPAVSYDIESNWFDELCDSISRMFGG
ncbi:MAG: hypothetical protein PHW00_04650 [Clostridia bacterium]|nr:hypothetical protein [Clostridia bacterium]